MSSSILNHYGHVKTARGDESGALPAGLGPVHDARAHPALRSVGTGFPRYVDVGVVRVVFVPITLQRLALVATFEPDGRGLTEFESTAGTVLVERDPNCLVDCGGRGWIRGWRSRRSGSGNARWPDCGRVRDCRRDCVRGIAMASAAKVRFGGRVVGRCLPGRRCGSRCGWCCGRCSRRFRRGCRGWCKAGHGGGYGYCGSLGCGLVRGRSRGGPVVGPSTAGPAVVLVGACQRCWVDFGRPNCRSNRGRGRLGRTRDRLRRRNRNCPRGDFGPTAG